MEKVFLHEARAIAYEARVGYNGMGGASDRPSAVNIQLINPLYH